MLCDIIDFMIEKLLRLAWPGLIMIHFLQLAVAEVRYMKHKKNSKSYHAECLVYRKQANGYRLKLLLRSQVKLMRVYHIEAVSNNIHV